MRLQAKSGEENKNSFTFACVSQIKTMNESKQTDASPSFTAHFTDFLKKTPVPQESPLKDAFSFRHF